MVLVELSVEFKLIF